MLHMLSSSHATSAPVRRLVLLPAEPSGRSDAAVRRYRLARLRLEGRGVAHAERSTHRHS